MIDNTVDFDKYDIFRKIQVGDRVYSHQSVQRVKSLPVDECAFLFSDVSRCNKIIFEYFGFKQVGDSEYSGKFERGDVKVYYMMHDNWHLLPRGESFQSINNYGRRFYNVLGLEVQLAEMYGESLQQ